MSEAKEEGASATRKRRISLSEFVRICKKDRAEEDCLDFFKEYNDVTIEVTSTTFRDDLIDELLRLDLKILKEILVIPAFVELVNLRISDMISWRHVTDRKNVERNTALFDALSDDTLRNWGLGQDFGSTMIAMCKTSLDRDQLNRLLTNVSALTLSDILDLSEHTEALKNVQMRHKLTLDGFTKNTINCFLTYASQEMCAIPSVRQFFYEVFNQASMSELVDFFNPIFLSLLKRQFLFESLLINKTAEHPYLTFQRLNYEVQQLANSQQHGNIINIASYAVALIQAEPALTTELLVSLNQVLRTCLEAVRDPNDAAAQAQTLRQLSSLFVNRQISGHLSRALRIGLFVLAGTLVLAGLLALIPLSGTNVLFVLLASIKLNAVIVAITSFCTANPALGMTPTSFTAFTGIVGGSMLAAHTFLRSPLPTREERRDAAANKLAEAITEYSDVLLTI